MKNNKLYYKKHRRHILKIQKKSYDKNKSKILKRQKDYYKKNRNKVLKRDKKYRKNHTIMIKKRKAKYYKRNKILLLQKIRIYRNIRFKTNKLFKLQYLLRNRLCNALKGNYKSGSAVKDLGCSIEFLKKYLEKKFYGKMTWSNWGKVWEIDHIKPLYKFDLTKRSQLLKACNYKNLQPLTIEDHQKKTAKDIRK